MHYDQAQPTVAGLEAARRTSAFFRTLPGDGPGPEGLLVEGLSSALRPGAGIVRRPVIDTAAGPLPALLAVVSSGRRIAVVLSRDVPAGASALMLVYGPFDAVYEVDAADLEARSPRVAASIAGAEPRLFTAGGRQALALCALAPRAMAARQGPAADRLPVAGRPRPLPAARALRLNRPGEWAEAFEAAMSARGTRLALSA